MKKITIRTIALALIFFSLGMGTQRYIPRAFGYDYNQEDLSLFWKVWDLMEKKYVGDTPKREDRIYGAIEGLVDSYGDDYSVFFEPKQSSYFNQTIEGSFGGIGAEIQFKNANLVVVAPLKNSPSEKAGLLPGDVIVKIDKMEISGISFNEAIGKIRGKKGTPVTLSVIRDGDRDNLIDITIVRDINQIIDTETIDGVFVIHLYNFNQDSEIAFQKAMREFTNSGKHKLILDLRNNPGGFLNSAVTIASYFVPQGKVIVTEDFGNKKKQKRIFRSAGYSDLDDQDVEILVLINKGSASASEILAGALQEHHIAKVVGTQSYGKGSVQELIPLAGNTSLKVTIAQWLTPDNNQISQKGIVPDYIVEDNEETEEDEQLDEAIRLLSGSGQGRRR